MGQKTGKFPENCEACKYLSDFGPFVTIAGKMVAMRVKHLNGQVACAECPNKAKREALMAQAKAA